MMTTEMAYAKGLKSFLFFSNLNSKNIGYLSINFIILGGRLLVICPFRQIYALVTFINLPVQVE